MKIRISGSPDLVKGWSALLEKEYGQKGKIYTSRQSTDLRYYLDIDDREADAILSRAGVASGKQLKKV